MWLDNLKELKREKGLSTKQLAERSNLPERTVIRVLSGETTNPYIDTLDRLATALDCTIGDILAGTKTVIGDTKLSTLQENVDIVTAEKSVVEAEKDLLIAENKILTDKVTTLMAEVDLLKMQLAHKDEIIAVHNVYLNLVKKQQGADK